MERLALPMIVVVATAFAAVPREMNPAMLTKITSVLNLTILSLSKRNVWAAAAGLPPRQASCVLIENLMLV